MRFEHCWEHRQCTRTCPVRETQSVFCWRIAQKENLCHPDICHQCSYRQNWMSKQYDFQEYLTRCEQQPGRSKARQILAIDDESNFLFGLEEMILEMGCTCLTAIDGEEGLLFAQETRPDLIITDIQMPRMNGLDLCRALKADSRTAGIPVIVVSVLVSKKEQEAGFAAGAAAYIFKPFDLTDLTSQIRRLLPPAARPDRRRP